MKSLLIAVALLSASSAAIADPIDYIDIDYVNQYIKDQAGTEALSGAIAVNAASSSIYMASGNGTSIGVGLGMYDSQTAVAFKLRTVNESNSLSFSVGSATDKLDPVVGAGFSHAF